MSDDATLSPKGKARVDLPACPGCGHHPATTYEYDRWKTTCQNHACQSYGRGVRFIYQDVADGAWHSFVKHESGLGESSTCPEKALLHIREICYGYEYSMFDSYDSSVSSVISRILRIIDAVPGLPYESRAEYVHRIMQDQSRRGEGA